MGGTGSNRGKPNTGFFWGDSRASWIQNGLVGTVNGSRCVGVDGDQSGDWRGRQRRGEW